MSIKELQEQIQEDIITVLDGEDERLINAVCQIIVDRFNELKK